MKYFWHISHRIQSFIPPSGSTLLPRFLIFMKIQLPPVYRFDHKNHGVCHGRSSFRKGTRKPEIGSRSGKPRAFLAIASLVLLPLLSLKAEDLKDAPYRQASLPIEERIRDLISRMTPEEKARQIDVYSGCNDHAQGKPPILILDKIARKTHAAPDSVFLPEKAKELWGNLGVGAIHDLYPYPALANTIQDWIIRNNRLGIPALIFEEGLHGSCGFDETVFPSPIGLGATWDTDLAFQTGAVIAAEMRARGIHMCLGPVLDLAREPRWGRVEENFGEDPYLTGKMGLAVVKGMQGESLASDHTIIAEPKHFAGHGSPERGLNMHPLHIGEREMRTIMLKSFEPAVKEGRVMGIMAAYHDIDGIPCTANPWLLLEILRGEMKFEGFVLADMGAIARLKNDHQVAATPEDAICLAINSGVDMQFADYDHDIYQKAIVEGLKNGKLQPQALDRAVSAVLRVKFRLGLFERPFVDPKLDAKVSRSKKHLDLSLRSSLESICLLRNEGKLLPLSKSIGKIAVIGPNGNQARLGDYTAPNVKNAHSILDGLKAVVPETAVVFDAGKNIPDAVAKTKDADVIIAALGENGQFSGEWTDRDTLDLPENQQALLEALAATGKPLVLVLQNGRPLSIDWAAKHVPAIVEAWYPGEFGGLAITRTLFGDNNPSGRLPVSFPRNVGQVPVYYNRPSGANQGRYVGSSNEPLFVFGFGLSYTAYHYDQLEVKAPTLQSKDDVLVSVKVTNTGAVAGDEIAQLYIRDNVADVVTPIQSLKGFSRIHLKPGESRAVTFSVPQSDLAVWNKENRWEVQPGTFTVQVGGSSKDTLKAEFTLQ